MLCIPSWSRHILNDFTWTHCASCLFNTAWLAADWTFQTHPPNYLKPCCTPLPWNMSFNPETIAKRVNLNVPLSSPNHTQVFTSRWQHLSYFIMHIYIIGYFNSSTDIDRIIQFQTSCIRETSAQTSLSLNFHFSIISVACWRVISYRRGITYCRAVLPKPVLEQCFPNLSWSSASQTCPGAVLPKPVLEQCFPNLSWSSASQTCPGAVLPKPVLEQCFPNLSWSTLGMTP